MPRASLRQDHFGGLAMSNLKFPRPRARRVSLAVSGVHALSRGLIALALLPLSLGLYGALLGYETRFWPTVEAVVVDQALVVQGDGQTHRTVSHGRTIRVLDTEPAASLSIRFQYEVEGQTYLSEGIERGAFGLQVSIRARELGHDHPVGTRTTVAVNPDKPGDAYLVPGISAAAKFLMGLGGILLAVGLWTRSLARASGPCVRV